MVQDGKVVIRARMRTSRLRSLLSVLPPVLSYQHCGRESLQGGLTPDPDR